MDRLRSMSFSIQTNAEFYYKMQFLVSTWHDCPVNILGFENEPNAITMIEDQIDDGSRTCSTFAVQSTRVSGVLGKTGKTEKDWQPLPTLKDQKFFGN